MAPPTRRQPWAATDVVSRGGPYPGRTDRTPTTRTGRARPPVDRRTDMAVHRWEPARAARRWRSCGVAGASPAGR